MNRCPGRESNRVSPEYKIEALPLGPVVRCVEIPLCLIRCMESEGLGPCWRLVMSFTLMPLWLLRKSWRYPLGRWLCGPQSWSGHTYEGKRTPPSHRESNSIVPSQPVTVLTELSRFLSWAVYVVMRGAGNCMVSLNRLRADFIYILHLLCIFTEKREFCVGRKPTTQRIPFAGIKKEE